MFIFTCILCLSALGLIGFLAGKLIEAISGV
jgi:hypothetical protein